MKILRTTSLIPVWLLTLWFKPFLPKTHPWKKKTLSLKWWHDGATAEAVIFGQMMWIGFFCAWLEVLIVFRR